MEERDIEHPDITYANRTGYPRDISEQVTADCGCEIFEDDLIFEVNGETFCRECYFDALRDCRGVSAMVDMLSADVRAYHAKSDIAYDNYD